jgi:hypothetical protein
VTEQCVFLVPFFGPLPPYFDLWARSCEANAGNFHWLVYSDQVQERQAVNPAVTLVPYTLA